MLQVIFDRPDGTAEIALETSSKVLAQGKVAELWIEGKNARVWDSQNNPLSSLLSLGPRRRRRRRA